MQRPNFFLHPAQEDIYTDQLINIKSPHYNIGGYIKLKGPVDREKFYQAVSSAPLVFDIFSIRFHLNEQEPVCSIDDGFKMLDLPEMDFSERSDPFGEAESWVQQRFNTPFAIDEAGLLFEHSLIKISADEHWFFCRYHHLITDGYGFIIFISYVARKYRSLVYGGNLEFSYPSYYDEAIQARAYKNSPRYVSDREYWLSRFPRKPENLLQKRYVGAVGSPDKTSTYILNFSKEERVLIDDIQRFINAGLQQLTIAALLIYFGKTSGHSQVVFGIPVHKRSSKQLRKTFGMFSGILPFPASFQKDVKLIDLLRDIAQSQKKDYRHHNYQIGDLSRALNINPSDGYLCDVVINHELLEFELPFGDEINASVLQISSEYQGNPLQLSWRDFGEQQPLQLHIHFRDDYFKEEEIELLAKRVIFMIRQFPEKIDNIIDEIDILPGIEKRLIEGFNTNDANDAGNQTIVEMFEEQALSSPESIALVFGDQQASYKQLNERSNRLAWYLMSKGVRAETLVPVCIERSLEMIVAILGILKAGGAYVPIDPTYPQERISFMLHDARSFIAVSSKGARSKMQSPGLLEVIEIDGNELPIVKHQVHNPHNTIATGQLAYVIYTSGSTGKPKGVMVEHRGVLNLIKAQTAFFNIAADERILQFSNYCFDASVEQIFLALCNGASLVLFREGLQLNTGLFEEFLEDTKVTHLHATPFFLENLRPANYAQLRRVIAGGDVCRKDLALRWKEKVKFYNEYGPTETTVTSIEYKEHSNNFTTLLTVPIGIPVANNHVYILNENEKWCPIGVPGEIYIGGAQVSRGYLNLPDLTAKKFVPDPFLKEPGANMYKTGDIGRWLPDGNIEYLGRKDDQVKVRGYRIELGEVESVLLQTDLVKQALVMARKNPEGNNRLVAYIVPATGFDKEVLRSYLQGKLPEYMVPASWVELDRLPLTSNGKIDKSVLPDPGAEELLKNGYVAPGNEMEAELVHIWKDLLHVERVGIHDNFFELGGHSLKAVQLISRIHKRFNVRAGIKNIFNYPTISELCRVLALDNQYSFTAIKRLPEQESYDLSHAQKRIWVLSHFEDGSVAYSVPVAFVLEGEINVPALQRAFGIIIDRHEILRTVFVKIDDEPQQKILSSSAMEFVIEQFDLRGGKDTEQIIKTRIEKESRQDFDLTKGPLLRATLFRQTDDLFVLVFNIHHIISDGWSKGILIREILFFYKTITSGKNTELPPLPIQYKDYAAWQAGASAGQQNFWRKLYDNGVPVLNFPLSFERPKTISFSGALLTASADAALTSKLQKMATDNKMTLNNLLLSLYGMLVARYSHQHEVVIGSLTSGRSHVDLETLVGVFINFLPIKLSPGSSLTLTDYLNYSQALLVEAYSNQDYPFDSMVNDMIRQRDISRNPFFDTMVNFHWENEITEDVLAEGGQSGTGFRMKPLKLVEEDFFHSVLDFKLDIEPVDHRLDFYLSYNTRLFTKERMSEFLAQFVALLEQVVNEPGKYIGEYLQTPIPGEDVLVADGADDASAKLSVNICASFVAEPLQEYLEYWSREFELNIKVSFSPYNQVFQQLLNPESILNSTRGMNVLFIRIDDWLHDKNDLSFPEQINFLDHTYDEFTKAIEHTRLINAVPCLVGIVPHLSHGKFDNQVTAHIFTLNKNLESFLKDKGGFHLLDLSQIASLYLVEEIFDPTTDALGHVPFTQEYFAALGTFISRKIRAYIGKSYKVLAVDCDNTLWKGVCGEAGALGVSIDDNFSFLQRFLLQKYDEGFLLALVSKNNEDDIWEVFEHHPGMIIRPEHIAAYRINWNNKHENLAAIAGELNVGVDSIVFLDDSEFEIEQLSLLCPDVFAVALPEDPGSFSDFLNHLWALDHFQLTREDAQRNVMYKAEMLRKKELVKYHLLDDFLQSLNIQIDLRMLQEKDLQRASQLTLRTNQFNLNAIRKSPEEIAGSIGEPGALNWIVEVKDRFGDYGIVGLVLARNTGSALMIESFMLSCRVLGRNVEDHILSELQNYCAKHSLSTIEALFKATDKNKPFFEFLIRTNWIEDPETNGYRLLLGNDASAPWVTNVEKESI